MDKGVKFIKKIRKSMGDITRYRLADLMGIKTQVLDYYEEKGQTLTMDRLCKLRDVSGLSWEELGKLIEAEYGTTRTARQSDGKTNT